MKSKDVRDVFLRFFADKAHSVVKSSSLIPRNDPTLLFTNAGMVQFKSVFLGEETRPYTRAATCQKSMRAGGKHSDLENVGHTARHHTFFEMLGNFSFGDYFKRDAIAYAWELLTVHYGLPKDKLYATVFEKDDEAEALWQEIVGMPRERIVRMGAKDNFWQMADTGPCGPCSEILIDQGEDVGCGRPDCKPGCDCDRFLELWNLVFMQYNRDGKGVDHTLPKPSIDTGMGLERISAVLQGKHNNFDSDLFSHIIGTITDVCGVNYGRSPESDASIRVMADHARSSAFLVSDGLLPANEGRGYVLRRIIRRASRHARLLNESAGPVLYRVYDAVAERMGDVYPELRHEREMAVRVLRHEEERFDKTLRQGLGLLDTLMDKLKGEGSSVIPGSEVFKLYDTFGFPVDLARDMALDAGFTMDEAGFTAAMQAQREKARSSWVGRDSAISPIYRDALEKAGATNFVGYETMESEAEIKAIIVNGRLVDAIESGQTGEVVLDVTPMYAEGGGQVGDTGAIHADRAYAEVMNTRKPVEGLFTHEVRVDEGSLRVGRKVTATVEQSRRRSIMRNHTATHLLHAALRTVLGDHVKQAGSLVEPGRLRFDFTHYSSMTGDELREVQDIVNSKVLDNITLSVATRSMDEAMKEGTMALFGEKYGDSVRVVKVPGFSSELCGGTHCRATGDIGPFVIESEGSVASGVRRIEAVTGTGAFERFSREHDELRAISGMLKSGESPAEKVRQLLDEIKALQKAKEKEKGASLSGTAKDLMGSKVDVKGVGLIAKRVDGLSQKELRDLADAVRDRLGSGVVVLASALDGQAAILSMVSKDLTGKIKAGNILKEVAELSGGRGGGKPDMAQGGTKELDKLDAALGAVAGIVERSM